MYFRSKAFFSSSNDSLFLISLPTPTLYTLNYTQVNAYCHLCRKEGPKSHLLSICWDRREPIGKHSVSCRPPTPGQIHLLLTPLGTCGLSQIGQPGFNRPEWVWSGLKYNGRFHDFSRDSLPESPLPSFAVLRLPLDQTPYMARWNNTVPGLS